MITSTVNGGSGHGATSSASVPKTQTRFTEACVLVRTLFRFIGELRAAEKETVQKESSMGEEKEAVVIE